MKLTPNFSLAEFTASDTATRLKVSNEPNSGELERLRFCAVQMEVVRVLCGNKSVQITSGFRSAAVNKAVGGSATSDHRLALAVDFRVNGLTDLEIARIIQDSPLRYDQIIRYGNGRLHIGFGSRMRRSKLIKAAKGYKSVSAF